MAINDIINESWQGHSHGEVENALKSILQQILTNMEQPIADNRVGINALTQALRDLINGAVPSTRKINGKQLSNDVTLKTSDLDNDSGYITEADLSDKVDKVPGKGLSTNDFSNAEKTKLAGIAAGAQVNVINGIQTHDGTPLLVGEKGVVTLPNIEGGEIVVASVDDIDIVDNMDGVNADTILAAASARMVKEIYLNLKSLYQNLAGVAFIGTKPTWQTVAKRTYTIGMSSADQNITLTDGNGNAVASPQNEGTPLTLRLSVANGYRFASVPTATMGNTNITFSLVGSAYVAEIGALSGNVVITASSTQVGTYSVNIPTGSVFCTSSGTATTAPSINEGEGVTCYIKPADGKRWSTTPSSTGATVTLQSGSIYKIVASNVQADITVNGSTENIPTYSVSLPTAGNGIASVALTDANDNVITSPVLEGTAVKIVLTPSPNHSITVSTATMESGGVAANLPQPTNVNGVLTYTINSVTGAIVISATAAEVATYKVTKKLLNMTASDDGTATTDSDFGYKINSVEQGQSYTTTLATANGASYNNDLKVYVGGVLLTAGTDYTYTNNELTIPAAKITGDIVIVATAATGIVKVTANTEGTTATLTHADNTTTVINCDTLTDGKYVGTANGETAFKSISFSNKNDIVEIDGGGAVMSNETTYNSIFGTSLTKLKGLVIKQSGPLFSGCAALSEVQTIGWSVSSSTSGTFTNCTSLVKIDVENVPGSGLKNYFKGCTSLQYARGIEGWTVGSSLESVFEDTRLFGSTYYDGVLDLSKWNTSNVTTCNMFFGKTYPRPTTLIIGPNFNMGNLTANNYRFSGMYDKNSSVTTIKVKSENPPAINASYNWLDSFKTASTNPVLTRIEVPAGCGDAYKAATGWSTYSSIIEEEQ